MSYLQTDPHKRFTDVVEYLNRVHRHRSRRSLHARPRSLAHLERRRRVRWVIGALVTLGVAVAVTILAT